MTQRRFTTLTEAAKQFGGLEDVERGGFVFSAAGAIEAAASLGAILNVPESFLSRQVRLTRKGLDGILTAIVDREKSDPEPSGWIKRRGQWTRSLDVPADQRPIGEQLTDLDSTIRCVNYRRADTSIRVGWFIRNSDGQWVLRDKSDAQSVLLSEQVAKRKQLPLIGVAIYHPWNQVCRPFEPEYPRNREWNRNAPQWRYQPSAGDHPTWDQVLAHCGRDLDDVLPTLEWARQANIVTGKDYLLNWIAILLRRPRARLPYLFLFGEQNGGKTTFHKGISLLLTGGVASGDRALRADHNGELENAVLACIEETDFSESATAYNKLKDWVTNDEIWIRRMFTDAYATDNFLHFVQTANDRSYCPIQFGDSRIVSLHVPRPQREIPQHSLFELLAAQSPQFMQTIVNLKLPEAQGRMALPVVETAAKSAAMEVTVSDLIRALVDRMVDESEITLACQDLPKQLGAGGWPRDMRRIEKEVETHRLYLEQNGLTITFPQKRTNKGRVFQITRAN